MHCHVRTERPCIVKDMRVHCLDTYNRREAARGARSSRLTDFTDEVFGVVLPKMASRRRTLLKVIILGDSGCVSMCCACLPCV